ncbi:MAG TPA: CBS domain-containing protein [Nitrososphaeraceae archaeon]|jgi:CBS domain-containing protein
MSKIIQDIMTKKIVTITQEKTGLDAAKLMDENGISSLIIENDKKHMGIITERDIVSKICCKDLQPSKVKVADIMSDIRVYANPGTPIEVAVQRMINHKLRRLPVIEEGKIVGIVTVTDLAKELRKTILEEGLLSELSE